MAYELGSAVTQSVLRVRINSDLSNYPEKEHSQRTLRRTEGLSWSKLAWSTQAVRRVHWSTTLSATYSPLLFCASWSFVRSLRFRFFSMRMRSPKVRKRSRGMESHSVDSVHCLKSWPSPRPTTGRGSDSRNGHIAALRWYLPILVSD